MSFTVVDWNVNGFVRRGQYELLRWPVWDIARCRRSLARHGRASERSRQGDVVF